VVTWTILAVVSWCLRPYSMLGLSLTPGGRQVGYTWTILGVGCRRDEAEQCERGVPFGGRWGGWGGFVTSVLAVGMPRARAYGWGRHAPGNPSWRLPPRRLHPSSRKGGARGRVSLLRDTRGFQLLFLLKGFFFEFLASTIWIINESKLTKSVYKEQDVPGRFASQRNCLCLYGKQFGFLCGGV
jgi:hypothetical protein